MEQAARCQRLLRLEQLRAVPPAAAGAAAGYERGLRGKVGRLSDAAGAAGLTRAVLDALPDAWQDLQGDDADDFDARRAVRFKQVYLTQPGAKEVRMRATSDFHGKPVFHSGLVLEADEGEEAEVPGMGDPDKVNAVLFALFFFYSGDDDERLEEDSEDEAEGAYAPNQCYMAYFKYAPAAAADKLEFGMKNIVPRRVDRTTLIVSPISALYSQVDVLEWFNGTRADPTRLVDGGLVSHLLTC